jgi:hypothetical protein
MKRGNILQEWERQHWKWMQEELLELRLDLTEENIPRILEEFRFSRRILRHPERCTLYPPKNTTGKTCHENLRDPLCFLCSCPHYDSAKPHGGCKIGSVRGFERHSKENPNIYYWDCNTCDVYHTPFSAGNYIKKHLKEIRQLMIEASQPEKPE